VQGYTRRQLKEDKFVESAQDAVDWASGHRRLVVWSIGLVILAGLAYFGITMWLNRQSEQANLELGVAMRTMAEPIGPPPPPGTPAGNPTSFSSVAERAKAAGKHFQAVADKFSYTKPGKIARYMQGVAALQAGDNAEAEQQLKTVADSGDQSVAALAKIALASLYRSSNRQSDAAKIYRELEDHPTDTVSKAQAQLEMAAMYESTDPQQAASIYQQIQKDDPKSAAAQIAAERMATVK
jgi:TolA-binding protein